jgi:hypothetical protein
VENKSALIRAICGQKTDTLSRPKFLDSFCRSQYECLHGDRFPYLCWLERMSHNHWPGTPLTSQSAFNPESGHFIHLHRQPYWLGFLDHMNNSDIGPALTNYDFERFFPHKSWVSAWAKDETYPAGYCYKILSVRDEVDGHVELVLIRAYRDGTKDELHRARVRVAVADDAAGVFSRGLAQKFGLTFEEQDYRAARSLEQFHVLTQKYGWSMSKPVA